MDRQIEVQVQDRLWTDNQRMAPTILSKVGSDMLSDVAVISMHENSDRIGQVASYISKQVSRKRQSKVKANQAHLERERNTKMATVLAHLGEKSSRSPRPRSLSPSASSRHLPQPEPNPTDDEHTSTLPRIDISTLIHLSAPQLETEVNRLVTLALKKDDETDQLSSSEDGATDPQPPLNLLRPYNPKSALNWAEKRAEAASKVAALEERRLKKILRSQTMKERLYQIHLQTLAAKKTPSGLEISVRLKRFHDSEDERRRRQEEIASQKKRWEELKDERKNLVADKLRVSRRIDADRRKEAAGIFKKEVRKVREEKIEQILFGLEAKQVKIEEFRKLETERRRQKSEKWETEFSRKIGNTKTLRETMMTKHLPQKTNEDPRILWRAKLKALTLPETRTLRAPPSDHEGREISRYLQSHVK